ncbi:XdhC family protein [Hyphomicrobium sp.]|uniref:XdhC family protein n=1 Tax=Hyphomicrobium sp. TaxID=82 RepID=UPI002E2EE660|nr:XdhC family protein [Hyphomicrobium sp.]HEX2839670.1 XdhC family protein [Hyphomicrobium sp.]
MEQRIERRMMADPGPGGLSGGLLADEDVVSQMWQWVADGRRAVLVTLVGVHGGAPRAPGAQMAVADDGRHAGYLSGGCLEQAIVLEAQDVISKEQNRLLRYGKGSPYIDIRLPCGSGLDIYFDQSITRQHLAELVRNRDRRQTTLLRTDLQTGQSVVVPFAGKILREATLCAGDIFERIYTPPVQLLLVGSGPGLLGLASLGAALGLSLRVLAVDDPTRVALISHGLGPSLVEMPLSEITAEMDFASAAVLVLHDHEREPDILSELLRSDCFYIGALGNHAVHRARLAELMRRGISETDCRRIRAPVGAISGAKSKATLAVGVLMEMMDEAKARHLVP